MQSNIQSPLKSPYFSAIGTFLLLMTGFLLITGILNKQFISAAAFGFYALVFTFLFFLPYLFLNQQKPAIRKLLLFIPFILSAAFTSYIVYGFLAGQTREFSVGYHPVITICQMYIVETLLVLITCFYILRRTHSA